MGWSIASFRGVPFHSRATEIVVGQRRAVYEFPFDSKGAAGFDLGRRARKYMIEGLLYPDQADDYDRMLAALEAPGPGLLVHPTRGAIMVILSPEITLTESQDSTLDDQPIVEFKFVATESRERAPVPTPVTDARSAVAASAVVVRAAASDAMLTGTRLEGVQDFIRSAHLDVLDNVIADIALLNGTISAALAIPGTFASQLDSISRQIETLLGFPDVMFSAFDGALSMIISSVNRVEDAGVNAFVRDVLSPGASEAALASLSITATRAGALGSTSVATLSTTTEERGNKNVTIRGIRASALCAVAEAAVEAPFTAHDDAVRILTLITAQIDRLAEKTIDEQECPDALFSALQDLRASLVAGIGALQLVNVVDFIPGESSDAAVIAYLLYGDADRADEIASRSGAAHPSFIPGAKKIRVLEK